MFKSEVTKLNKVVFPEFNNERIYMQKFYKNEGLPKHLRHWQPTIDCMLETIETDDPIYLMVDQKIVTPNTTHRRAGPHIDGYWIEGLQAHGSNTTNTHSFRGHSFGGGGHVFKGHSYQQPDKSTHLSHLSPNFDVPESILLASDVAGCIGYVGEWKGNLKEGGDCSDINLSNLEKIILEENFCYKGNVTFIHESIIIPQEIPRTLVRLNLKNV